MPQCVILAGGLGTRLRTVLDDRPKPLAPILGRPFLAYQIAWLRRQGVDRLVLCVGYRHEQIQEAFGDGREMGIEIAYAVESTPQGTAHALKLAAPLLDATFAVINGDTFFDTSLAPLWTAHRERDAAATLALVRVPDVERFGSVTLEPDGRISGFIEKGHRGPGLINAGLYIFSRTALEAFPETAPLSLERDIFPALAAAGRLQGCESSGYHLDIGTPESYARFVDDLTAGRIGGLA